jgi:hypothetical protein
MGAGGGAKSICTSAGATASGSSPDSSRSLMPVGGVYAASDTSAEGLTDNAYHVILPLKTHMH